MSELPFAHLSFPELYEQALVGPLFRPWVEPLLDAVALAPGDRLLDLACGTGIVAREARRRLSGTGKVVGVDLSPPMLAVARRVAPEVEWREGDAGALPLQDPEQFDVVVCQQGFQFFPDQPAAAREMRRALAPNGRLALSTWRPDQELPVLLELRRIAEKHLGAVGDRRHSCGDPGPVEALLSAAGLSGVRSVTLSRTIRFENGSVFVRLNAMALVGMSPASKDLSEAERGELVAAIAHDSAELVQRQTDARGFAYDLSTNLTTARG